MSELGFNESSFLPLSGPMSAPSTVLAGQVVSEASGTALDSLRTPLSCSPAHCWSLITSDQHVPGLVATAAPLGLLQSAIVKAQKKRVALTRRARAEKHAVWRST